LTARRRFVLTDKHWRRLSHRAYHTCENSVLFRVINWARTHTHTHTHPFDGPFSRTTWVSRYQKGKTNLDLLKQETVSGSGISWAVCKRAPRSRLITTPAPHHSVFTGWMPFLPFNQQLQSTEGKIGLLLIKKNFIA